MTASVPVPGLEALALSLLEPADDALAGRLREEAGAAFPPSDDMAARKRDFDRLFLVPGPSRIVPLESAYRTRTRDREGKNRWERPDPGVLVRVRAVYRHFEFHVPDRWSHQPDHAGVEMMFLHCLGLQEAVARDGGDVDLGDRLAGWQQSFRADHLNAFVPALAEDLIREAGTGCYREVGRLLLRAFPPLPGG